MRNARRPGFGPLRSAASLAFLAATISLAASVSASLAATSEYTKIDFNECLEIKRDAEGISVVLVCKGFGNYPVYVAEGDLRFDVDFGEEDFLWQSFGPFNSISDTVEWRVHEGVPHAAILRYFIDGGEGSGVKGEALVISKVAEPYIGGCVVGIVDAGVEQANAVARGVAATAPYFDCSIPPVAIGSGDGVAHMFSGVMMEGAYREEVIE